LPAAVPLLAAAVPLLLAPEAAAVLELLELQAARATPRAATVTARAGLRSDRLPGIWVFVDFTMISLWGLEPNCWDLSGTGRT
jgi:hypothetical protein